MVDLAPCRHSVFVVVVVAGIGTGIGIVAHILLVNREIGEQALLPLRGLLSLV